MEFALVAPLVAVLTFPASGSAISSPNPGIAIERAARAVSPALAGFSLRGLGDERQEQLKKDPGPKRGHHAIWDHLAVSAALGTVAGVATGHCNKKAIDVTPVLGHVALGSLISLMTPSKHLPAEKNDRFWDGLLVAAGAGALSGFLWSHGCDDSNPGRASSGQMTAAGAVIVGTTGLVLDVLHRSAQGSPAVSIEVNPRERGGTRVFLTWHF